MKKLLFGLALVFVLLSAERAVAQVPAAISVNIKSAQFQWQWAPDATGSMPDKFVITCGTIVHAITNTSLRSYPVSAVVTVAGTYACSIHAANTFGKSAESNTVNFSAGDAPAAVPSFSISAN